MSNFQEHRISTWNQFCNDHDVLRNGVQLFEQDPDGAISTIEYGKKKIRNILKRSSKMEELVISEVEKVLMDYKNKTSEYDGLIYMMYRVNDNSVIPLYIGKSEKFGRNDNNLSANIKNIAKNKQKFCRWGYNNKYHIGELSAAVLTTVENDQKHKYSHWALALFETPFSEKLKLKFDVRFWIKAWKSTDIGPWEEFGPTSLTFLEYQLIGVASALFPKDLLNKEGVNRGSIDDDDAI